MNPSFIQSTPKTNPPRCAAWSKKPNLNIMPQKSKSARPVMPCSAVKVNMGKNIIDILLSGNKVPYTPKTLKRAPDAPKLGVAMPKAT